MLRPAPDPRALESAVASDVLLPGSPEYESLRKPAIARFDDVRPYAVVACRSPTDVAETIAFARGAASTSRFGAEATASRDALPPRGSSSTYRRCARSPSRTASPR